MKRAVHALINRRSREYPFGYAKCSGADARNQTLDT